VRDTGADATIVTAGTDLREAIKAAGIAPDVVYDPVGGALAEPAFRSIAWRGRYLVVGFAAGPIPALPFNLALLKGASIVGVFWGDFVRREPKAFAAQMRLLVEGYQQGRLKPAIDAALPMRALPEAYARMASRRVMGKLVLVN
jgi:NADPH:quinone reductase